MKKGVAACFAAAILMVVLLAQEAAAICSPTELSACLLSITAGVSPSQECCSKLKEQEQQSCFCGYVNDPRLKPYVDSPNAHKVAVICGVTIPRC